MPGRAVPLLDRSIRPTEIDHPDARAYGRLRGLSHERVIRLVSIQRFEVQARDPHAPDVAEQPPLEHSPQPAIAGLRHHRSFEVTKVAVESPKEGVREDL